MERGCPSPVIACDWFSFSFRGSCKPALLPVDFQEELLSGTNIFAHRAIYWYRGSKVITVMGKPKSKVLRSDMVLVEVANRWLYDHCELSNIMNVMFPWFRVNNMSRIDICADFECNANTMETIQRIASGECYVSGKKTGAVWYDEGKSRVPFCLNFGSIKSEVKWKLYNKTKEIAANTNHCEKPWIRAFWLSNGLDVSNVWRLEVSYHGERFGDDNLSRVGVFDMQNESILRVVFAEFYKYRFVVRERGHTRKINDKVVPFLSIPEVEEGYISRQRQLVRGRYDDSHDGRILVDRLCRSYVEGNTLDDDTKTSIRVLICDICDKYGYYPYVRDRWDLEFEDRNPRKVLRG